MKTLFSILFLVVTVNLLAQTITLSGYIKDALSGETLYGATIYDKATKNVVLSNEYGFYSLELPRDTLADISVSYIGYSPLEKYVACIENQKLNFYLQTENLLDEVTIIASKQKPIEKRTEMGVINIPVKQLQSLPALGGETDIIKAMQLMPGVQSGNEGSSQLFVRGGSPDQNLILLDDVPLYYVNHLGGFVSVFNTDAVNNVKLIKGGFPAKYGNRLSSIVDIRMKEGNNQTFGGKATIGVIASKVALEGPIKNQNTSYIFSVRRMLYDLITRPVSYFVFNKTASAGYYFYDINAKINHRFSDKNRLYFSIYKGDDKMGLTGYFDDGKSKFNTRWGNNLAALRFNHTFNNKLFSNSTLSYTRYRFLIENIYKTKIDNQMQRTSQEFKSAIYDLKLKNDFNYYLHPKYSMRFGIENTFHTFQPGVTIYQSSETNGNKPDTVIGDYSLRSFESAVYLENDFSLGEHFSANIGLRYNLYQVNSKTYTSLEPRILFNFLIQNNSSIKASYSKMQQNVHLLTSTGMGMPVDLWLPATDEIPPQFSKQWALGFAKSIDNNRFELSIETYYKQMNKLITYKEGATYLGSATNWQDKVETEGKGNSYGVELLLQKKEGKTTGWFSYTWAKTNRLFNNINDGKAYPFKYDRRHDISLVVNHKLKKNIDFSATWSYGTGYAYTLAIGKYQLPDNVEYSWDSYMDDIYIYDGRNNQRMRDFHRLDIGFNFYKKKKKGERIWNVSVLNVYNRQNPYFYYIGTVYDENEFGTIEGSEREELLQQSLFPIIPSVSYSFKF